MILAGVTVNLMLAWLLFFVAAAGSGQQYIGPNTTVQRVEASSGGVRRRPPAR